MLQPLVSIVIPAYNAAHTLQATMQSALAQTLTDFEVIIVDDGSSDDTLAIAQSSGDKRVRVLTQANGGVSSARNAGINAAVGKYVAFLDADDLWVPHKLERQVSVLENGQGISAVQSGAIFVNDALEVLNVRPCNKEKDTLLDILLFQNLPNLMSTLVISRDQLHQIGCFDTDLEILEDWDIAIKAHRYCNLTSIEEPLSLYRVHSGNRSRNLDIHIKPGFLILNRLFNDTSLPADVRKKKRLVYAMFYAMLSGGAFNIGQWRECANWGAKAILAHPASFLYMTALPLRRLQRHYSRRQTLPYSGVSYLTPNRTSS